MQQPIGFLQEQSAQLLSVLLLLLLLLLLWLPVLLPHYSGCRLCLSKSSMREKVSSAAPGKQW
jgi:hypothetical protein